MSARHIFIAGGAVAVVVAVIVFRGTKAHGSTDVAAAFVNGLGGLTAKQKAQIEAHAQARTGRAHF